MHAPVGVPSEGVPSQLVVRREQVGVAVMAPGRAAQLSRRREGDGFELIPEVVDAGVAEKYAVRPSLWHWRYL